MESFGIFDRIFDKHAEYKTLQKYHWSGYNMNRDSSEPWTKLISFELLTSVHQLIKIFVSFLSPLHTNEVQIRKYKILMFYQFKDAVKF